MTAFVFAVAAIAAACSVGRAAETPDPRAGWSFAFTDFVIAGWAPPPATEADYALVRAAHFNLVMTPRYALPQQALDLAAKHGLKAMIDTYTPNDRPWGGSATEYTPHPSHHPATLPELKWLHERYGKHPALAGYLLGDDYGKLPPELLETVRFLHGNAPQLFPWICQNDFRPESLVEAGQPLADPQLYPTLYQRGWPVAQQCELLCDLLDRLRQACNRYHLISWPMFNVTGVESPSLLRFQPYACLAYGAQGLWYFTYDCLVTHAPDGKPTPTPAYRVVEQTNATVARWGPELLGRKSVRVVTSGLEPQDCLPPGEDLLVRSADKDLLVGILVKDQADTCALVVDTRVGPEADVLGPRRVRVTFAREVRSATVVGAKDQPVSGNVVTVELPPGGGQLVRLRGEGVRALAGRLEQLPRRTPGQPTLGPDALMGHWTFDEGQGKVARDHGPLKSDLQLSGPVAWAPGKTGGALDLSAAGAVGNCYRANLPDTEAMSIEAWVKPTRYPTGAYGCILYVGKGSVDRFEFGLGPDSLYPVITNGSEFLGGELYVGGMKARLPEGAWGHIAVVAGPQGAATYVNGQRVAQTEFKGRFDFWHDRIELGARGGGEEYEGLVDEIRIWGRVLTEQEIQAHAKGG